MINVPVYNKQGAEVGTFAIDERELGGTVNAPLIKQAYVCYHANLRQGTSRTRNRHEIEGSTKKLYRQKGTGRARHGDRKVPQFRGGGHAFAKRRTREDYHLSMPKKMKRKANRNALLAKLVDQEVRVVDDLTLEKPRTQDFVAILKALKVDRRALVALSADPSRSRNTRLSARNVADVTLCRTDQLTCFSMLNHRYLVIERGELESWLGGPWSQTGKEAKVSPMGRTGGGV